MSKKFLSLALALVMCLGLTVPALAASLRVPTPYTGLQVTLSDVTAESTAAVHGTWSGNATLKMYTVPVGSSITIDRYCDNSITKCELGADGAYTGGDIVHRGYSSDGEVTIVWDESYANAVWWVSVWQIDSDGFLVKVDGTSTPTTKPTEPEQPTDPEPVTPPAEPETANPTNDKLAVNGAAQNPTVFKIGGSNYFKIRDVAALLNGTEKQFAVGYDGAKNAVTATIGQGYAKQSGDLAGAPAGGSQTADPSNDAIYVNGEKITAEVYKINGSNYFKLRDLGKALNFYVGWSADRGMYIETNKPYSE